MIQLDSRGGSAVKCGLGVDLLAGGGRPPCAAACPMRALDIGPLDELQERHGTSGAWARVAGSERTAPAMLIGAATVPTAAPPADDS